MVRSLSFVLMLLAMPAASQDCKAAFGRGLPPEGYAPLVDAYREGFLLDAIQAVAAESPAALERFVRRLEKTPRDARSSACLRAAALVHTEVALFATQELAWEAASVHFELAHKFSGLVDPSFRRNWLLIAALFYQEIIFTLSPEIGFYESTRYFDEAVETFPRDAEVLLAAGTVWEWSGSLPAGDTGHLKRAQELYERALRADPDVAEAKLRYGKVLAKRGKLEEAEEVLRDVLALPADHHIIYRAHMALGSLLERARLPEEAIRHYRAAVEILPSWQVGYIALSHALHTAGARDASRDTLNGALRFPPRDRNATGWWSYEVGLSGRAEPLFLAMRAEILL